MYLLLTEVLPGTAENLVGVVARCCSRCGRWQVREAVDLCGSSRRPEEPAAPWAAAGGEAVALPWPHSPPAEVAQGRHGGRPLARN